MENEKLREFLDYIFYVYVYLNPRKSGKYKYEREGVCFEFDYEPYYVGKGNNDRLYDHLREARKGYGYNQDKIDRINEFLTSGFIEKELKKYIIKYKIDMSSKAAYDLEEQMIKTIGRIDKGTGPLTNMNDGYPRCEWTLVKRKEASDRRKEWWTPERKEKRREDMMAEKHFHYEGKSPQARAVRINEIEYSSITEASRKLNKSYSTLWGWIQEGKPGYEYVDETDEDREARRRKKHSGVGSGNNGKTGGDHYMARACRIHGIDYPSITDAARELDVTRDTITYRIDTGKEGYAWAGDTQEDIDARKKSNIDKRIGARNPSARAVIINGKYFSTIKEASQELNIKYSTLAEWIRKGKHGYKYATEEDKINEIK